MAGVNEVKQTRADVFIKYDSTRSVQGPAITNVSTAHGDLIALSIKRAVNEPAGMWGLTMWDHPTARASRWWQDLRPMDYIEFRIKRLPAPTNKQTTGRQASAGSSNEHGPLVMRGFVDQVTYGLAIGPDQKPQRTVTIQGRDYGKLLLIKQIIVPRFLDPISSAFAAAGGAQSSGALFQILMSEFFNKIDIKPQEYLDKIEKYFLTGQNELPGAIAGGGARKLAPSAPKLHLEADSSLSDMTISHIALDTLEGPVWNLMRHYQGDPVTEFVMQELDDKPQLLWRWTPYKDKYKGRPLKTGGNTSADPVSTDISPDEILTYTMTTTDRDVYNYYFTWPASMYTDGEDVQGLAASPSTGVQGTNSSGHPTTTYGGEGKNPLVRPDSIDRYGYRAFYLEFPLLKDIFNKSPEEKKNIGEEWQKITAEVTGWLDKAFTNSATLEFGRMTVKGNPNLQAGTYLHVPAIKREWYIQAVEHVIQTSPVGYVTNLDLVRGMAENSPYPDDRGQAGVTTTVQGPTLEELTHGSGETPNEILPVLPPNERRQGLG